MRQVVRAMHPVGLRVSSRYFKFTTCDLYFQSDFVCDKEAQSFRKYFACIAPAQLSTQTHDYFRMRRTS